jgi:hypothetical protein
LNAMPTIAGIAIFGGFGLGIMLLNYVSNRTCCGKGSGGKGRDDIH